MEAHMVPASISRYLEQHGVNFSVVGHAVAYTAQEEAAVTHVPGREWAKAVVCMVDDQPTLAVLPANRRVDLHRLREACGARSARLASEAELRPLYSDCEVGAMPPFGPLYHQPVVVDKSLTSDPEISFNGGSHSDAIRMRYRDFEELVKPTVADFGVPMRGL
jgi:Ala-tRNA(Pro) deacylase